MIRKFKIKLNSYAVNTKSDTANINLIKKQQLL